MITAIVTSTRRQSGAELYFSLLEAWDSIPLEPVEPVRLILDMSIREMATTHISADGTIKSNDLAPVLRDIQRVADIDDHVIILCEQEDPADIMDVQMSGMFNAILSITDNVIAMHQATKGYVVEKAITTILELTQQRKEG